MRGSHYLQDIERAADHHEFVLGFTERGVVRDLQAVAVVMSATTLASVITNHIIK